MMAKNSTKIFTNNRTSVNQKITILNFLNERALKKFMRRRVWDCDDSNVNILRVLIQKKKKIILLWLYSFILFIDLFLVLVKFHLTISL